MAAHDLKGLLERSMPWIVVFWCFSHRLELALNDALRTTYFSKVEELLLRLYYLYEKSPKKCRELNNACGTRFVAHKVAALGRIIERFGAYISHLSG